MYDKVLTIIIIGKVPLFCEATFDDLRDMASEHLYHLYQAHEWQDLRNALADREILLLCVARGNSSDSDTNIRQYQGEVQRYVRACHLASTRIPMDLPVTWHQLDQALTSEGGRFEASQVTPLH